MLKTFQSVITFLDSDFTVKAHTSVVNLPIIHVDKRLSTIKHWRNCEYRANSTDAVQSA